MDKSGVQLSRVLGLRDLVVYGIVLITPIAPVGVFGVASQASNGHAVTTILFAMVAMMFTAYAYGQMASAYPSAGSAWVYVSRGIHPSVGFLAGWAMLLDYLIVPLINITYIALAAQRVVPAVPFAMWAILATAAVTLLNWRGVRLTARVNSVLLAIMCVAIAIYLAAAVRHVLASAALDWQTVTSPFYNPQTFQLTPVLVATSLATLTFIGFDGVTTLAEEVRDPTRTVPRATVLVCLITGVLSAIEIWLAQLVWPAWGEFRNLETAFLDVAARIGGPMLFHLFGSILVVACFGSALAGQASAARLLYGMGRDGVLPTRVFAYLDPTTAVPARNILLLATLAGAGALVIPWEQAVGLLNFGAFLSFMGVNLAAARRLYAGRSLKAALPVLGFFLCFLIWIHLPKTAWIAGGAWILAGLAVALIRGRSTGEVRDAFNQREV